MTRSQAKKELNQAIKDLSGWSWFELVVSDLSNDLIIAVKFDSKSALAAAKIYIERCSTATNGNQF